MHYVCVLCSVRDCVLFKFLYNETFIIWSTYSFWKLALFSENRFTVSLHSTLHRTRPILGLHSPHISQSTVVPTYHPIGSLVVLLRPKVIIILCTYYWLLGTRPIISPFVRFAVIQSKPPQCRYWLLHCNLLNDWLADWIWFFVRILLLLVDQPNSLSICVPNFQNHVPLKLL